MKKLAVFLSLVLSFSVFASEEAKNTRRKRAELEIKVVPWGPTQAELDLARQRVLQDAAVRRELEGIKYRIVATELIDDSSVVDKSQPSKPPTRFRLTIYDYTNDECIIVESDIKTDRNVSVRREIFDPGVGYEELSAAYEIVSKSPDFADSFNRNEIEFFEPMPPTTYINGERLVNVGLQYSKTGSQEIVSVSFKNEKVIRYAEKAPPTSKAGPESCGIPNSGQGATGAGIPGQYQLTVTQGGMPLWEMLVIRPSASSGRPSERSGLEIRDVKYKGKSVLKRGHAPILTVQYVNNTCGPYRDWQYAEGFFQIPSSGVTFPNGVNGGIAILPPGTVATTAIETRNDTGNFQGVAIYRQDVGFGEEVVLVTEMNAGWYRYIMEWRFAPDGTIRPRYGFASTANSCVCNPRTHHVYWRFDFDIVQPNNKIYQVERGRKFIRQILTEAAIFRDYQFNRSFLIQNANGDEAYIITPGMNDGSVTDAFGNLVDTFGAGDFWLLRFQGTPDNPGELDDPNTSAAANLAPWVSGESLDGQDIVVWYSAHQYRVDDTSVRNNRGEVISGVHVVGPTLKPVRW
ncbi:MAG: hypothetical protein N2Z23_03215 [Pyrinomonadaceae bacterium]|nr:hypothetical protein [Pyrinomonadaceae bacterium]MCX7639437.1 hypothetical protein [Pyrinomonadaceae bacterium]MDW8304513.1 hypothetical protein [Acidobacteriota bacterium]